jgi:glycosyltransferase involved in cell wall biosynthesis
MGVDFLGANHLRIALFTGNYNYIKDGVALTLNRVVEFLRARDVPVLVFAPVVDRPALPSTAEIVPIPSFPIPRRPEYRLATGLPAAARRRLAAFRPTLFHIVVPDLLGLRALKLAQRWSVPVLATYHTRYDEYLGYYGLGALKPLGKNYLRYFYSRCELVCPPSESMLQSLQSDGIIEKGRIWSRGVESELFHPRHRSQEWRRSLGFTDNEIVVTFAGRLVKEKNTTLLANVLRSLSESVPNVRPLIVGDGPERARLLNTCPSTVFAGFLNGEALARAYASSDIFFFPSATESFGNVTLEAMASGLPAVCADATGSGSLVLNGLTGYLVCADDCAGFVDRLASLIAQPAVRARMGAAARARALTFEWASALHDLYGNYLEVLTRHQTVHPRLLAKSQTGSIEL